MMTFSPSSLAELRAAVRTIEQNGRADGRGTVPFGLDAVDGRLAGGGLAMAALHEAAAASGAPGDMAAATLFVAAIALFPDGRRRRIEIPIELLVLALAFFERAFTSYVAGPGILSVASGSVLVIILSGLMLMVQLRVFRPAGIRRVAA